MQLLLQRLSGNSECTMGALSIDGASQCFTLELPTQFEGQQNVPLKTCILAGDYEVDRLYSPHFQRMMPHLVNVSRRTEVEIHIGNKAEDIRGCIIVGELRISDTMIGESAIAFEALDRQLEAAWANGERIYIKIEDIQYVNSQGAA